MLNPFPVRVIVNGSAIYELAKGESLAIGLTSKYPHVVVSTGFHYTEPVQIKYHNNLTFHLTVSCRLDNDRLLAGGILTVLFFLAGLTSGILLIRIISFLPVLYLLYSFYINRKSFIQLRSVAMLH